MILKSGLAVTQWIGNDTIR